MTSDRPSFTRKARPKLDPNERARLITEFSEKNSAPPQDTPEHSFESPQDFAPETKASTQTASEQKPVSKKSEAPSTQRPGRPNAPSLAKPTIQTPEGNATQTTEQYATPKDEPKTTVATDLASGEVWSQLDTIPVDPQHLAQNLIITAGRHDPAHGAFDVLRTRLIQTLFENDWKHVAITSPTRDCGKTFTAVNLAISLSRYETNRTVLMDMDMRNPSVARVLGAPNPNSMGNFLQGTIHPSTFFKRLGRNSLNIGSNLAVGLNDRVEPYAAELMQNPNADGAFKLMMDTLAPDLVLYDLPPALAFDDVIAFRKQYDGVLMVIGGGTTTSEEINESMRRIGDQVPLLGVVLNQAEGESRLGYTYGY